MPEDNFEETRSAMTEQNGQWYGKYRTPYLSGYSIAIKPSSREEAGDAELFWYPCG